VPDHFSFSNKSDDLLFSVRSQFGHFAFTAVQTINPSQGISFAENNFSFLEMDRRFFVIDLLQIIRRDGLQGVQITNYAFFAFWPHK
jgi:hypothetical protein